LTGLLTFVLRPLRRLEYQVREVEAGTRQQLAGEMPSELAGLAGNLNALIATERRRLVRYRNLLDDLAHSLKTPLAAMRTLLNRKGHETLTEDLDREVDRMDQRVSYQLRRARASGATGLGVEPTAVAPIVHDLVDTLDKVYRDKQVRCQLDLAAGLKFYGDGGDLSEMLGNLLDNAYKYCAEAVTARAGEAERMLWFEIENDGDALDPQAFDGLLERGARADESVPGQGIGLAVVREAVALYNGSIRLVASSSAPSCIRIELGRPGFTT
jgi:two-component system sensor histidine kinase PhoQ